MNKQRVALHFSLRLGNLASNYRICLTVLGGLRRLGVSLQSQGLAEECQMERLGWGEQGDEEAGRGPQQQRGEVNTQNLSQGPEGTLK